MAVSHKKPSEAISNVWEALNGFIVCITPLSSCSDAHGSRFRVLESCEATPFADLYGCWGGRLLLLEMRCARLPFP